jgi:hypothetical protein
MYIGTVRNHGERPVIRLRRIVRERLGNSDGSFGYSAGNPFRKVKTESRESIPLLMEIVSTMESRDYAYIRTQKPWQNRKNTRSDRVEMDYIVILKKRMERGDTGMRKGIQMLRADTRHENT